VVQVLCDCSVRKGRKQHSTMTSSKRALRVERWDVAFGM